MIVSPESLALHSRTLGLSPFDSASLSLEGWVRLDGLGPTTNRVRTQCAGPMTAAIHFAGTRWSAIRLLAIRLLDTRPSSEARGEDGEASSVAS